MVCVLFFQKWRIEFELKREVRGGRLWVFRWGSEADQERNKCFLRIVYIMSKSGKKVDVWRPSIATQPFRAKIAAKGSHAERFQSAVDRAVQETMRAKEIKREYSPIPRSKGGRRRTLKRGGKYCKKYGRRKSKKCGCSMFSFR